VVRVAGWWKKRWSMRVAQSWREERRRTVVLMRFVTVVVVEKLDLAAEIVIVPKMNTRLYLLLGC
jgi:hypothetical protein